MENSGVPQGKFLQRQKIPLPTAKYGPAATSGPGMGTSTISSLGTGGQGGRDNNLHWSNLRVGETITLLGRTFKVYGADEFTRRFFKQNGITLAADEEKPVDKFTDAREAFMRRETGKEVDAWRGKRMSPVKRFMEATRGNANPRLTRGVPDSLGQFLRHDGQVLRFRGLWDDTDKVYGQKHYVSVRYYLSDDTFEVLEIKQTNDGGEPFRALFKRGPLPHSATYQDSRSRDIEDDIGKQSYVTWQHPSVRVGKYLNVMARPVLLYDADPATYEWYAERLGSNMRPYASNPKADEEAAAEVIEVEPAPYAEFGFGTEEDSLSSFFSLVPKVPRRDHAKLAEHDGRVLRFTAKFEPTAAKPLNRIEATRSFTLTFFMATDEVSVYEPPQRNSGVVGGKFLLKTKLRNPDTGDFFRPKDFRIGGVVTVNGHSFRIQSADAKTSKLLGGRDAFEDAEALQVVERLRGVFSAAGLPSGKVFASIDRDYSGYLTLDEMEAALLGWSIPMSRPELIALFRFLDHEFRGTRLYRREFEQLFDPEVRGDAPVREADVEEPGSVTQALRSGAVAAVGAGAGSAPGGDAEGSTLLVPPDDVAAVAQYGNIIANNPYKLSPEQERILTEVMAIFKRGYLSQSCERILSRTFATYDKGSDGIVTRGEFRTVMSAVFHLGPREIAVLEARFFPDSMSHMNYKAFMTVLARSIGRHASAREIV